MERQGKRDRKNRLSRAIQDARKSAEEVKQHGHRLVEEGQRTSEIADCARRIVDNIPDDDYVDPSVLEKRTRDWEDTERRLRKVGESSERMVVYSTASSAFITTGFGDSESFRRPLPAENQAQVNEAVSRVGDIVQSASWDHQVEEDFVRLGIDKDKEDQASGLTLLRASQSALNKPSGSEPEPGAVLIPMREALHRTIADLLPLRRRQKPAKRLADKVTSICQQMGVGGLGSEVIGCLSIKANDLIGRLSDAKQAKMSPHQVRNLFVGSLAFLRGFLAILDEKKLRK